MCTNNCISYILSIGAIAARVKRSYFECHHQGGSFGSMTYSEFFMGTEQKYYTYRNSDIIRYLLLHILAYSGPSGACKGPEMTTMRSLFPEWPLLTLGELQGPQVPYRSSSAATHNQSSILGSLFGTQICRIWYISHFALPRESLS